MKKRKTELKLRIISKGKERRYKEGVSKAKKDKLIYVDLTSAGVISNLSILGEKIFNSPQQKIVLIGGIS